MLCTFFFTKPGATECFVDILTKVITQIIPYFAGEYHSILLWRDITANGILHIRGIDFPMQIPALKFQMFITISVNLLILPNVSHSKVLLQGSLEIFKRLAFRIRIAFNYLPIWKENFYVIICTHTAANKKLLSNQHHLHQIMVLESGMVLALWPNAHQWFWRLGSILGWVIPKT